MLILNYYALAESVGFEAVPDVTTARSSVIMSQRGWLAEVVSGR